MSIARQFSASILFLLLATSALFAQTTPTRSSQEQTTKTSIIIERQLVRFVTQGEAVEWHLVVTNQQEEVVFVSGTVFGTTLDWPLKNQQDEPIQSGLYAYTLTTKGVNDEAPRTQRGHLIVDRASSSDRIWLSSTQAVGLGAESSAPQLSVVGNHEVTLGGVELSGSVSRPEISGERDALQRDTAGRSVAEPAQKSGAAGLTPPVKTNIPDDLTVNGNLIFTPPSPQFTRDITMQNNNGGLRFFGAPTLTTSPAAAAIQFWGNASPFPGQLYLDSGAHDNGALIFRTAPTGGTIAERMRVTSAGDVLIANKWRTETTAYTPNLIGGFLGTGSGGAMPGNRVTAGVVGATIGGGGFDGTLNYPSGGTFSGDGSHRVLDWFGTVGGGFSNVAGNNNGTLDDAAFATVGGGYFNFASGFSSTVGGGQSNNASGFSSTVGGGYSNIASTGYATVAGGHANTASTIGDTVGGGNVNTASGGDATVGGGSDNTASGSRATVPGGYSNTAQGPYSFAAGRQAQANHQGAFVWADSTNANFTSTGNDQFLIRASGGVGIGTNSPLARLDVAGDIHSSALRQELTAYTPNLIAGFLGTGSGGATPGNRATAGVVGATIGGGGFNGTLNYPSGGNSNGDISNRVTDWFGTVGGGLNNVAGNNSGTLDDAADATVGGGRGNTASGVAATISGGDGNTASGRFATVGGGNSNTASGFFATVPGGNVNTAQGDYSFAAGRNAKANHQGAFVWADSTNADFASTGNDQFLIRASGGVGLGTNSPSYQLDVAGMGRFQGTQPGASSGAGVEIQYGNVGGTNRGIIFAYDRGAIFGGPHDLLLNHPGGNVGIGTTSPDQTLTVNGGADKPGGGSWGTFSDERLKNIRGRFTPGLKAVMQLRPLRYEYKADNALGLKASGEHIGFSAQAVQAILPEAVTQNDQGYLLVNNDPILWTMLNAIKEQQQEIKKQQQEIKQLKGQIRQLQVDARRRSVRR